MARPKGENVIRKHFKLTEENGLNINQLVKNNNSHLYRESDKINLIKYVDEINGLIKELVTMVMTV